MSKIIGMIHMAKSRLGMDDTTYREFLTVVIGRDSLRGSTSGEQWRVMEELKRRGFVPRSARRSPAAADSPQARKIRSLWLTMADCGIVRDRSEKALGTYVRRITGGGLADASTKQLSLVIETLKRWLDRCDDPRKREICLSVLKEQDAPPMLDGLPIIGGGCGEVRH